MSEKWAVLCANTRMSSFVHTYVCRVCLKNKSQCIFNTELYCPCTCMCQVTEYVCQLTYSHAQTAVLLKTNPLHSSVLSKCSCIHLCMHWATFTMLTDSEECKHKHRRMSKVCSVRLKYLALYFTKHCFSDRKNTRGIQVFSSSSSWCSQSTQ